MIKPNTIDAVWDFHFDKFFEAVADYCNKTSTRVNMFGIEKEDQNYCVAYPKWLTG